LAAGHRLSRTEKKSSIIDMNALPSPESVTALPIVFEQRYTDKELTLFDPPELPSAPVAYSGMHIFVLVHGYQGTSFDMRLIRNTISLLYPKSVILCSTVNEERTNERLETMGENLATEVNEFIQNNVRPTSGLSRLSFIGHSIGGLIVRAALPFLQNHAHALHALITLGTMHLGYLYSSNKLLDAGIWAIQRWTKGCCLQQLQMQDLDTKEAIANIPKRQSQLAETEKPETLGNESEKETDTVAKEDITIEIEECTSKLETTALFRLSTNVGLSQFRHVVLVSSFLDQYAPYSSARVEKSEYARDDEWGIAHEKMVENMLKDVNPESLMRLDVNFVSPDHSFDTLIGRWAHMQFLENQALVKLLVYSYPAIFG